MIPESQNGAALPAIDPDGVFSIGEVAELLRVSKRTVCRWRECGEKTARGRVRLNGFLAGRWRVTGRALTEFLDAIQPVEHVPEAEPKVETRRRSTAVDLALKEAGFRF